MALDQKFGTRLNFWALDQEMLALDQEILARDQELLTLDQEMLALDQAILALDQEHFALDQDVLALDQEIHGKHKKTCLKTHKQQRTQLGNPRKIKENPTKTT